MDGILIIKAINAELNSQTGERFNQLGGSYRNGKPLSPELRKKVIEMSVNGIRPCEISRRLKVTHGCISKLLSKFYKTGSLNPGHGTAGRPRVITPIIEEHIERYRKEHPGIFSWEIRERLLRDNICAQTHLPSLSSISRLVKNKNKQKVAETPKSLSFTIKNILSSNFHKPPQRDMNYRSIYYGQYDGRPDKDLYFATKEILSSGWADGKRYHEDRCKSEDTYDLCSRKRRIRFSDNEQAFLQKTFELNPYPSHEERDRLSKMMGVDEARIQVWFSNRRAKAKKSLPKDDRLSPDVLPQNNSCHSFIHLYNEPSSLPAPTCNGPSRLFFPPGYRPSD